MKMSNWFIGGLVIIFFVLSFQKFKDAQPEPRSERIYDEIRKFSPYYLEKRIGGFRIMMKGSSEKEQPPIDQVWTRLDQLDKGWGFDHISIINNDVIIKDNNDKEITKIKLQTKEEKQWVEKFYLTKEKL
jgi:hypothetical protein